jgi:hypothetical protein
MNTPVPVSERAARSWSRWYTRGLPAELGAARRDELTSDLYEHRAEARDTGASQRRVSLEIVARLIEGVPADLSWRRAQRSRARSITMATNGSSRGYPLWLTIALFVMGGLALAMSLSSVIGAIVEAEQGMALWAFLLFLVGTSIVAGLLLTNRAPRTSVALVALGAVGFGLTTYWMVVTVVVGVVVAAAAVLSVPRVVGPRPAT